MEGSILDSNSKTDEIRIPVSSYGIANLQECRKWVMFIAIVGFVIAIFSMLSGLQNLIGGFGLLLGFSSIPVDDFLTPILESNYFFIFMICAGLFYAASGAVVIVQALYEYRFAKYTETAIKFGSSQQLAESISYIAKSLKLRVISLLLTLAFSVLLLIGVAVFITNNKTKIQDALDSASDKVFTENLLQN